RTGNCRRNCASINQGSLQRKQGCVNPIPLLALRAPRKKAPMGQATFRIWRSAGESGQFQDYTAEITEGMVVLDAVHQIQATQAPDLACRWNCKAGKCGSCSAEVNGVPRLMCMTRVSDLPLDSPIIVEPMQAFPRVKDLVTDVSWNYEVKRLIKPFQPRKPDAPDGTWRMAQADA